MLRLADKESVEHAMPVSYNLHSPDPLIQQISQVRLELGDVPSHGNRPTGVRPNHLNFDDEEILYWLRREKSILGAVIAACEALSREWASYPDESIADGTKSSYSQVSKNWAERARELREIVGNTSSAGFSAPFRRNDGYGGGSTEFSTEFGS